MQTRHTLLAACALAFLAVTWTAPLCGQAQPGAIGVTFVDSSYRIAPGSSGGWFRTGQPADIQLSGPGFNRSGGPLFFNHPGLVATDGKRLLLADRNNNRVLIWNALPAGNVAPDLVLGQQDFETNDPGRGAAGMNWPVSVVTAKEKVVVADTYNDRILIWNAFPARNGQPPDLVLATAGSPGSSSSQLRWPWGVWTDGDRLAVSSTGSGSLLIWSSFPTRGDQPPDLVLTAGGLLGTPRMITSNGDALLVGDHNARTTSPSSPATFVWKHWPASSSQPPDFALSEWRQGTFTEDGRLFLLSMTQRTVSVWNQLPADARDEPDLVIGQQGGGPATSGYGFFTGDGSGIAAAAGRLYLGLSNGNKVVGYHALPSSANAIPDFAIGSPDIETNTLQTSFVISNPVVASNGTSLFVSSDFDRRLYVWRNLPDESGARPDLYYTLPDAPWDIAVRGNVLALAGKKSVYVWTTPPTAGQMPAAVFTGKIGSVSFDELQGVALDDRYFYLADSKALYVWEGIPTATSQPLFTLALQRPGRIDSDGTTLAVVLQEQHRIALYRVADLSSSAVPSFVGGVGVFNLPGGATVSNGRLFVGDTGFNRVLIWNDLASAAGGRPPDVILGATSLHDFTPEIGQSTLFWPSAVSFAGGYLWVGEFKFSERILRYSVAGSASRRRSARH